MRTRQIAAALTLSASALVGIALHEGYRDTAYIPVPGDVPTISFGTTEGVKMGDRITPPKALARARAYLPQSPRAEWPISVERLVALGLTLGAGVYGATFFMLTGFHGAHVTLGTVMLAVMLVRILRGHFDAEHQFGFEAASWYWHFVDVVWIALFVFVYVL